MIVYDPLCYGTLSSGDNNYLIADILSEYHLKSKLSLNNVRYYIQL